MDAPNPDEEVIKLPPRRAAFVAEYLIDLNGTQAAIRAGYSSATANEQAAFLLANDSVREAVARGKAQRASRVNTTADSVLHEMSLLSHSNIEHYFIDDFGQLKPTIDAPEGAMRAIKSIKRKVRHDREGGITYEVEFTLWDKPGTLKLMGKHANVAACFDRVELTGKDGGPLEMITKVERIIVDPKQDADE
jgi:phage terminase small subunit